MIWENFKNKTYWKGYESMYKGRLISEIINEWISEKSKRIEKIKKDFKELREILSKPKNKRD